MTGVLDLPVVDTVTLDEAILDETAKCARCQADAEYRVRALCCPAECLACGECEAELNMKWAMSVIVTGGLVCAHCRTRAFRVEDAVTVNVA